MANQEHIDILMQGVDIWNKWRREHRAIRPDFRYAHLKKAYLAGADLSEAHLGRANLYGADLRKADLHMATLPEADLREADLRGAYLREAHLYGADLRGSDNEITRINRSLINADLEKANINKAHLNKACLSGANLRGANLTEVDLSGADLSGADLSFAYVGDANLSAANLQGTNLRGADLIGANLSGVILQGTMLAENDLRAVKGLVKVNHQGPSYVEVHTIKLPKDGSALHFLRGAGVPDEWIDFWRTTMLHPIQYHSCFISYAHQDEMLAQRLHADLQDKGIRCWFAPEDMKIGDKIRSRIDQAIHLQDKLLLLLSQHAIASSWVEDEVEAALEKEQQQQREVIFPIRLDESVMQTSQAWAAKLRRTRHIGDFTNWTDLQAYHQTFERLLRDLHK